MTEVITEVALFFSLRGNGVGGIMIACKKVYGRKIYEYIKDCVAASRAW